MKRLDSNSEIFFALVKAGLWGKEVRLSEFGKPDFKRIHLMAREQSVTGLVTSGLEYVSDIQIDESDSTPFLQEILMEEGRNSKINRFVAKLFGYLAENGVKAVLIKGQGVAQCYLKPLWRTVGDVDLFLDEENYQKAKAVLVPTANHVDQEVENKRHLAMILGSHAVELHGVMHTYVSRRVDAVVDEVQKDIFSNRGVRYWDDGGTSIPLPSPDNDVIIIFTHFIGHFYVGGMGLRQISDWCRLLWTYKDEIDRDLLGKRLNAMKLMPEWEAFAAFAVELLDMPAEAMPFYNVSAKNTRRALKIQSLMLHTGNFGHNRDESYRRSASKLIVKIRVFFHRFGEFIRLFTIFPSNTPKFFVTYVIDRVKGD